MGGLLKKILFGDADRIFVQIASYRDPECQWTIRDLFLKAAKPERINVGICWQYEPEEDAHCFVEPYPYPRQIRERKVKASNSKGVCWARYEAQKLYRGEDYVLMIDSHMRFVANWDEILIGELQNCESDKPILTSYPPSYTPPDKLEPNPKPTVIRLQPITESGDIRGDGIVLERFPAQPLKGAFLAAGFLFTYGNIIKQVPYDPYMYFDQEEISFAVRAYTHGWDIFHPSRIILYHYYTAAVQADDAATQANKSLHWDDNKQWQYWQDRARKRLKHLLGYELSTDRDVIKGLDGKYGIGQKRTIEEFAEYAGIDFQNMTILPRAQQAGFIDNLADYCNIEAISADFIQQQNTDTNSDSSVSNNDAQENRGSNQKDIAIELVAAITDSRTILQTGYYMPAWQLPTQQGQIVKSTQFKGCSLLLIFLPVSFTKYIDDFAEYWHQQAQEVAQLQCKILFVIHGTQSTANTIAGKFTNSNMTCLADSEGYLFSAFGHKEDSKIANLSVFISPNNKIIHIFTERNAQNHIGELLRFVPKQSETITGLLIKKMHAPVLLVPNAIDANLSAAMLQYYQQELTAGNIHNETAIIKTKELKSALNQQFSHSIMAELRKIMAVSAVHTADYAVIACKAGRLTCCSTPPWHIGGNTQQQLSTNKAAIMARSHYIYSALNDKPSSMIMFPEYDNVHYQLPAGWAIIFCDELLHKIIPPKQEDQYILCGKLVFCADN